jgi:hypothetical protein
MADEKNLKLGLKDRLMISELFPERSNLINQTLAEDIGKKIRISQEEMTAVNFRTTPSDVEGHSNYVWDGSKDSDKDVSFSQAEIDFLKKQIDRFDKDEQITPDMLPLFRAIQGL